MLPGRQSLNVVVVDEELPYPPNSGKRLRTLNLITRLARRHRITYLSHRNQDPAEAFEAETYLRDHGIEVMTVTRPNSPKSGPVFYGRLAANLCSPLPYSVQSHKSESLKKAVRQLSDVGDVDMWHVEWTPYAECVRHIVRQPWIVMAHNIESQIWQRYYETETNLLKRWYIGRQWRKFHRFEQKVFSEAHRAVVVSDADAELASRWFRVICPEVVSNGVDVAYFHSQPVQRDEKTILFLGSLDWRPNLDAVDILLREVFPRVVDQEPEARLVIVGRKPPEWLRHKVSKQAGVTLHADVSDVRPFLWRSGLLAVPLRIGGGSRLKILEALACQCPVVSTRVGSEGLNLVPGQDIVEVSEVADMSSAIVEMLSHYARHVKMAECGCKHVLANYSWDPLAERLERIWVSQIERQDAARSRPARFASVTDTPSAASRA